MSRLKQWQPSSALIVLVFWCFVAPTSQLSAGETIEVGFATVDITPPVGFPMAGYYFERLAEGTIDPLYAKAIVLRDGERQAAWVVCDLIGISRDLAVEVKRRVNAKTGILEANIVLSATHTHTAPQYSKELYLYLGKEPQEEARKAYISQLIEGIVAAIVDASKNLKPSKIRSGSVNQSDSVSFNRRFVMRDGKVRTWMSLNDPNVVRAAGPIDPEIGLIEILNTEDQPVGVLSSFALHLDTVGGTRWSADYPHVIERTLREKVPGREKVPSEIFSLFGTGCCGDINHSDPTGKLKNTTERIGRSLGETIASGLSNLQSVGEPRLFAGSSIVNVPLQPVTKEELTRAVGVVQAAERKEAVDFFDHVDSHKKLVIDHLRNNPSQAPTPNPLSWGLSHDWGGVGDHLPVEVSAITLGKDVAIVFLPGEVFVDLGLEIKRASPFRTTLVVELSNAVETIYIPHRAAYAGGSYEVTNSTLQPGSGEMLVEAAIRLLQDACR